MSPPARLRKAKMKGLSLTIRPPDIGSRSSSASPPGAKRAFRRRPQRGRSFVAQPHRAILKIDMARMEGVAMTRRTYEKPILVKRDALPLTTAAIETVKEAE